MHTKQCVIVVALVAFMYAGGAHAGEEQGGGSYELDKNEAVSMSTNVAVVQPGDAMMSADVKVVDPGQLLQSAPPVDDGDIQEDPNDPFMFSKKGKLRPRLAADSGENWAEPTISASKPLIRKKRCDGGGGGGGGGGGDGGNARRGMVRQQSMDGRNRGPGRRGRAARRRAQRAREQVKSSVTTVYVVPAGVDPMNVVPGSVARSGSPVQAGTSRTIMTFVPAQPQQMLVQPGQQVAGGQLQVAIPSQLPAPVQHVVKAN